MSRPNRDTFWFGLAAQYATRATCPRAAIGAVLSDSLVRASTPVVLRHVAVEAEYLNLEAMLALPKVAPVRIEVIREHVPMPLSVFVDVVKRQESGFGFTTAGTSATEFRDHFSLDAVLILLDLLAGTLRVGLGPRALISRSVRPMLRRLTDGLLLRSTVRAVREPLLRRLALAPNTPPGRLRSLGSASLDRFCHLLLTETPIGRSTCDPLTVVRAARLASPATLRDRLMASPAGLR